MATAYKKTIICLANSKKTSGRCIAGKELIDGAYGPWIRPISGRQTEEISEEERMFENGDYPQILDIITIKFIQHKSSAIQPENHLIDDSVHWKKQGEIKYSDLTHIKDTPAKLWTNGNSSSKGENDRFAITDNHPSLSSSLYLIYLEKLEVKVFTDSFRNSDKRKVRALFQYNKDEYNLSVTDPRAEYWFLKKSDGIYNIHNVYLCVSLGPEFKGHCYKFVASIIKDPPF